MSGQNVVMTGRSSSKMSPQRFLMFLFLLMCIIGHSFADLGIDIELQSYGCDDRSDWLGSVVRFMYSTERSWCSRPSMKSWIKIGGKDVIHTRRGWNIVVINHRTGAIEATRNFDTHGNLAANHDMTVWVRGIANKRIIVGVAHDDYAQRFDHRGVKILNSIAGGGFKRMWRGAAAFIGYKDSVAPPDSLVEKIFLERKKGPAQLRATIGKIKYGNELQFTLQSIGYLDKIPSRPMTSYIKYGKVTMRTMLGFNFMVIDHSNGDIYSRGQFNTHDFSSASDQMLKFLRELPRGMIVLGVVLSGWTRYAAPSLHKILHQISFSRVPSTFHGSYAMIGYTGGRSALQANDFPLSRWTTAKTPRGSFRHGIKINYFTSKWEQDECTNGRARCGQNTVCRNTIGSYKCDCKDGFKKRGGICVDINECAIGRVCGSHGRCINTQGSYNCECVQTNQMREMGITCQEIKIMLTASECFFGRKGKPHVCKKAPLHFYVNGRNVLNNPRRGFNIVVLDSHTGRVEKTMAFDTGHGNTEGTKLASELQKLKQFKIVIGGVMNGESRYITPSAKLVIKRLTGVQPPSRFHGAYGFVGFTGPGVPSWAKLQQTPVGHGKTFARFRFWLLPKPPLLPVSMVSVGSGTRPKPSLKIGEHDLTGLLKPGFNIVVVGNDWTGSVESVRTFNTHSRRSPDIPQMVNFLNNLPVDRMVAGLVVGDCFQGIERDGRIQAALGRLLAAPIKLKQRGASYAFIGATFTGGARKPPYIEQASMDPGRGPLKLSPMLGFSYKPKDLQVSLISTGCDDQGPHRSRGIKCSLARCSIKVNKKEMSLKGRGMNIVAVSQIHGHVFTRKQFEVGKSAMEAEKMAKFLDSLPFGTIVLGAVKDDAYQYFHAKKLKAAMKKLLGKDPNKIDARSAYAFIGYKGKVLGKWVQQRHTKRTKGGILLDATIPLKPGLKISLVSMTCSDPGIINHQCTLAKNSIKVNGKEYSKNKRGFNVAIIDFKSGDVEETSSYDTFFTPVESKRMEAYIKKLPKNKVVCGVVKDEGYNKLTQGAKDAIASLLHKRTIPFNKIRTAYAFVGFTSPDNYFWIQDKWTDVHKGPARLNVGIPLVQSGCVFPVPPLNGDVKRVEYTIMEEVEYKCEPGTVLKGTPQVCGDNGTWIGSTPKCIVDKTYSAGRGQGGSSGTPSDGKKNGATDSSFFDETSSSSTRSNSLSTAIPFVFAIIILFKRFIHS